MKNASVAMAAATAVMLALTASPARAAACAAEYAAMEHAADVAMAACQSGGDVTTCTYLWGIFEGRAQAYEDCIDRRDSQGPL